jgi:L-lysine exporter family protein LysE/ArgO
LYFISGEGQNAAMSVFSPVSSPLSAWLAGLLTGLGLFAAVGAQSAFILRLGLLRAHIVSVLVVCALADAVAIFASVVGMQALTTRAPWLIAVVTWCGIVFLAAYALRAGRRALRAHATLAPGGGTAPTRRAAVLGALGFTLFNPHFWLDITLVGTLARGFGAASLAFGAGASTASVLWLAVLGGGARLLAPVFRDARAWRMLEGGIAVTMAGLALGLAARVL